MNAFKSLGHTSVVYILGLLGLIIGGQVPLPPAVTTFLHMPLQVILAICLSWAYVHFGVTPPQQS